MNKTVKVIVWVIVIALAVWLIFLNDKKEPVVTENQESIKIGVSTVLTGDFAAAGENMVNAAKLAMEDVNADGGIDGRMLELVVEDAGWDSKTGLAAAQKLINVDGVKYIVGGTSSNGTVASAPLANENKVVYLTPVTGGANIDAAGEYIFRTANSDLLAGRDIARAMDKLGYKKVGVVAEVTEYTIDFKKSFLAEAAQLGLEVAISEEFAPETSDFRTIIAKVKEAKPDAILVASQTGLSGAHFMKQAREVSLETVYFSDFTFVVNENAKAVVGSFEGVYFADPAYDANNQAVKDFFTRYETVYGKPSLIPFHAAASYDDVMLLANALNAVGDDSEKVHNWLLKNVKNYRGLMGTYSLDENGNSDLGFIIKVVKDGQFVEVK